MTNEQSLPITDILEERINKYQEGKDIISSLEELETILPQVHSTEKASQKKAKEEERERIVGILKYNLEESQIKISNLQGREISKYIINLLIERITSDNQI